MLPIDERAIRASFRNASRKEASSLTLPPGFGETDFSVLDYRLFADERVAG